MVSSASSDELPACVGAWRLGRPIGRGGAGRVYLAHHIDSGAAGALKVAHTSLSAMQRHWFHREANLAARLRHPAIVPLLDSGDVSGRPYLVYEHVDGPDLESIADTLSFDAIVHVGATLFEALAYAHDAGVVHCDISPSNVVLAGQAPHRQARLIDFGLAKARNERPEALTSTVVSGTPGYVSPEQARGSVLVGPASDLFGCGAVLFRLLSGHAPYAQLTTTSLTLEAPMPFGKRHGIDDTSPLGQVVMRLLAEDPELRYITASAARRAWLAAASGGKPTTSRSSGPSPARPMSTFNTQVASTAFAVAPSAEQLPKLRPPPAPPFIQRGVLERLRRELDAANMVVLHGARGTGRTRLVDALVASQSDWRVARVHGRRELAATIAGPPFECAAALALALCGAEEGEALWRSVERLSSSIDALELNDAASAEDALIGGLLGAGPSGDTRSAQMGALEVLVRLVGTRPTLLIVDDGEHVDDASWELLRTLTHQPGVNARVLSTFEQAQEHATNVHVPDWTQAQRAKLWVALGGKGDVPEGTPIDLRAHAGAASLGKTSLPAAMRALLGAACAFGGDAPLRGILELSASGDQLAGAIAAGLAEVVNASVARRERWIRVPSKALRATLQESTGAQREAALRWLSRCCQDAPHSNLPRVASLASDLGMDATAAYALAEAGQLAFRAQNAPLAASSLMGALSLGGAHIDRARVLCTLASAFGETGDAKEQARCANEALACIHTDRTVLRARLLRLHARAEYELGNNARSLALLEDAVALIGSEGDPMESARCHAALGWLLGYRLGRNEEGIALGQQALHIASKITAPAFQASLCGRLGANYLRAGDWEGQLRVNLKDLELSTLGSDIYGRVRANINLGVCFTNRGALETAREHTLVAYELGVRHGARGAAIVAASNLAMIATHAEDDVEAERWVDRVRALSGEDLPTETFLSLARVHLMRSELTHARAAHASAEARADHGDREHVARVGALIEMAEGDVRAARQITAPFVDEPVSDPYERAVTLLTHVETLRRLGEEAEPLKQRAVSVLERLGADVSLEERRWANSTV